MQQFANGRYSFGKKVVSSGLYWMNFFNLPNAASGCQLFWLYKNAKSA